MGKVLYSPGIELVSGALKKINTKSDHVADQNMLLGTHRRAETRSNACERLYIRKVNNLPWNKKASYALSQETIAQRLAFKNASIAIAARKKNLTYLTQDQDAFIAIKSELESAGYKPTFKSFLWAAYKKYEGTFPQSGIEMTAQEFIANVGASQSRWW